MSDEVAPPVLPTARPPGRRWQGVVASTLGRLAEVVLAGLGLAYVLGPDDPHYEARFLGYWDLVAVGYLIVGFWVVRRGRHHDDSDSDAVVDPPVQAGPTGPYWRIKLQRKFNFLLTVIASLTGLGAATDVLVHGVGGERDPDVRVLGLIAVFCAWSLLHVGYAAFYRYLDNGPEGAGLRFPRTPRPNNVDYMYFAITLGVSFAASDVEVISRRTRWHVLVHEVVSFFYNAAVLAIAVSVITSR